MAGQSANRLFHRKKMRSVRIVHLMLWLAVSLIFFLYSERVVKLIFPGYDGVELWLSVLAAGLITISILVFTSYAIAIRQLRVRQRETNNTGR